jgi:UDP-glucose 4-epimerase
MVVPRFVDAAMKGNPLTIYGDGTQTRCFTHVLDVIDALIQINHSPRSVGIPINIGNSEEISILDLAKLIIARLNSISQIHFKQYEEVYGKGFEDMERRIPDTSRLTTLTGWAPKRNLMDIIADLVP